MRCARSAGRYDALMLMLRLFAAVAAATMASWNACTLSRNVASGISAMVVPVGYCAHHDEPLRTRVSGAAAVAGVAAPAGLVPSPVVPPCFPSPVFVDAAATTEFYARSLVGSVRCV